MFSLKNSSLLSMVAFALMALLPAATFATHQSWHLHDPGTYCRLEFPGEPVYSGIGAGNFSPYFSWYICPVNLGGQFNGQNGDFSTISVHATVPSLGAEVYYDDQNTNGAVTCTAYAVSSTGSIYWSREAHSELASVGKGTLRLAQAGGWGGSLGQATMDVAIRGLAYECGVPGTVDFKPSAILGYQTIICANNSQCVGGI